MKQIGIYFLKNGLINRLKTLSRCANFMQNSSVAVSWEPPNSPENIIEGNLQGSKLPATDVPESTISPFVAVLCPIVSRKFGKTASFSHSKLSISSTIYSSGKNVLSRSRVY